MRKRAFSLAGLVGLALMAGFLYPVHAAAQEDGDDPPGRVARLSFTRGPVSFEPAGTEDWVDATVNRPVTTGDKLWTDRGARAALHIGSASLNLSENTGFSFLNLTDNMVQLQLSAGKLRIRVKRLGDNENFEVDTPNLAFSVLRPGVYTITVNDDGNTTIIEDRSGEGEVTGEGSAYTVHAGELDTFSGTNVLSANVGSIYDDDDEFERWCEQRDHHEDNSVSARYVSDDAIGYDDLDDYGGWRPVPEYGTVWFPHTTVIGWAPYHFGHWAYIAPWGYTWVDDAPWGFAPFHYGRWVFVSGAWGWVPCPPRPPVYTAVYVRPVYAPALVAWVGGPHFSIGVSIGGGGGVGWFPLGPREVYVPSYPVSRTYVNRVNISNTTVNTTVVNNYYTNVVVNKNVNVTNVTYVNQHVQGAVMATTSQAFSSGQPVARNMVRVDAHEVASAPVAAITPPSVPQREAVLGGRSAAIVRPPVAIQSRVVVAKATPPPPPPSFAQHQAAIQSNGGRPLSMTQVRQMAPVRTQAMVAPPVRMAPPARPVTPHNVQASQPTQPPSQNRPASAVPVNNNHPVPNTMQPQMNSARPPAQPMANNNSYRPPTARPVNEQLEQQHQQQNIQLHNQQDMERQKLEQQHQMENQQLQQQKAEEARQKLAEQQHEQQLQQLQQKHQEEQQQLQLRQEQEHREAEKQAAKPPQRPREDRPPNKER